MRPFRAGKREMEPSKRRSGIGARHSDAPLHTLPRGGEAPLMVFTAQLIIFMQVCFQARHQYFQFTPTRIELLLTRCSRFARGADTTGLKPVIQLDSEMLLFELKSPR